jgi:hypothetical protein
MAPPSVGGVQHSCASTLTRRPSLTSDVDDVASQLLLAKHETLLKVHGVFDESFGPKRTKSIGDEVIQPRTMKVGVLH